MRSLAVGERAQFKVYVTAGSGLETRSHVQQKMHQKVWQHDRSNLRAAGSAFRSYSELRNGENKRTYRISSYAAQID